MNADHAIPTTTMITTPSRLIERWTPEDPKFWRREGRQVAARNLRISILALMLAFAVWMVWSVVVVNLPAAGFRFSTNQLFWLAALPALCGATLRIFYAFAVPIFGGRRWTAISTALLLLPTLGIGFAVQDPNTSYEAFVALALLCGLGGGNFASSMSNISFFYPTASKGTALGLNAGLGNLGVSLVQIVVPIVITVGAFGAIGGEAQEVVREGATEKLWLQNAGFVWAPFIVLVALVAWFGMNDIADARGSFTEQAVIFTRKHNWIMCWLYVGTFGSFIGYSAGFPMLIKSQFPGVDALAWAWVGPLVGALMRPVGGWLADKLGGARITFWAFVAMALGVVAVMQSLPQGGADGSFYRVLVAFLVLFAAAGIGNGSTFKMIPVIFLAHHQRATAGRPRAIQEQGMRDANKESGAVLGFASAIGAFGGFFIPKSYGTSLAATGSVSAALLTFIVFYVSCIAMTWWYYSRRDAEISC